MRVILRKRCDARKVEIFITLVILGLRGLAPRVGEREMAQAALLVPHDDERFPREAVGVSERERWLRQDRARR